MAWRAFRSLRQPPRTRKHVIQLRFLVVVLLLFRLPTVAGLYLTVSGGGSFGDTDWALNLTLVTLLCACGEAFALWPLIEFYKFAPITAQARRGQRVRGWIRLGGGGASFCLQLGCLAIVLHQLHASIVWLPAVLIILLSAVNLDLLVALAIYTREADVEPNIGTVTSRELGVKARNEEPEGTLAQTYAQQVRQQTINSTLADSNRAGGTEAGGEETLGRLRNPSASRSSGAVRRAVQLISDLGFGSKPSREWQSRVGLIYRGDPFSQIVAFASVLVTVPFALSALVQGVVLVQQVGSSPSIDADPSAFGLTISFPCIALFTAMAFTTIATSRISLRWTMFGLAVADALIGLTSAGILVGIFAMILLASEDIPSGSELDSKRRGLQAVQGVTLAGTVGMFLTVCTEGTF